MNTLLLTPDQTELVKNNPVLTVLSPDGIAVGKIVSAICADQGDEPDQVGTGKGDATIEELRLMFDVLDKFADSHPDILESVRQSKQSRAKVFAALLEMEDDTQGISTAELLARLNSVGDR